MPVTVLIPTALRGFAGGKAEIEVTAATAGEALLALGNAHPELNTSSMSRVPYAASSTFTSAMRTFARFRGWKRRCATAKRS